MSRKISGTLEWAVANRNCLVGCSHDCRYCYARAQALRFKRTTVGTWGKPVLNESQVCKRYRKEKGTVMFPTTHDILPEFLEPEMEVIGGLLSAGNHVLVVSKPHLHCITEICKRFPRYRDNILFRFTIGAFDDDVLDYWEPHAPHFLERFSSLKYAFEDRYQTSVSVEPMLDSANVVTMFQMLEPFVTDGIWIGKMNKVRSRVCIDSVEDERRVTDIEAGQTNEKIWGIYEQLKGEPKIRWKESIKEIVGLPTAIEPGEDR